jgi:cation transport ATPase
MNQKKEVKMPEKQYRNEKEEKQEKEEKTRDEKDEKSQDEKWKNDPLGRVIFGLIVIAVGILLFLATQDMISWEIWWAYLLLALGGIFLFEALIRSIMPAHRRPVSGKVIAGLVLITVGASNIYGLGTWWPLIIIGVGVVILFNALFRIRK